MDALLYPLQGLRKAGITHVLNVSGLPATFPGQFTYLSIEMRDKEWSNLLSCIPVANIFMEAGLGLSREFSDKTRIHVESATTNEGCGGV